MVHWSQNSELKAKVLAKISASKKGKGLGNINGFVKGHKSWNQGLKKETNELVNQIAKKRCKPLDEQKGWLEYGYLRKSVQGKPMYVHHMNWIVANQSLVPSGHIIHHKDGNKLNNNPQNLELLSRAEHTTKHHSEGTMNPFGYNTFKEEI